MTVRELREILFNIETSLLKGSLSNIERAMLEADRDEYQEALDLIASGETPDVAIKKARAAK